MAKYKHHSRLIKESQIISTASIVEGMILSFSYSTTRAGTVTSDFTPIVLVLYRDRKKGVIEGINLNYLVLPKIKKMFTLVETRLKSKILTDENIPGISKDFTRVQISSQRRRSNLTPKRFYEKVVTEDPDFQRAYRQYKYKALKNIAVVDLKEDILQSRED